MEVRAYALTLMLLLMATGPRQQALCNESALFLLLPVSPLIVEWRWNQHKHKRDQREANWWEEAMPISKVKKERWCDGERKREKGRGVWGEDERGLLCHSRGTGTLCTWAHLLWSVLLIPKAMSTWLARGWKRQITIQIILHPFTAISEGGMVRSRLALESPKPFRRCRPHYCCSS